MFGISKKTTCVFFESEQINSRNPVYLTQGRRNGKTRSWGRSAGTLTSSFSASSV